MRLGSTTQDVNLWRLKSLGDLELIHARYHSHRFPRHFHEEYIIGIIVHGVEEINYRGTVYLAPAGSLILINPGEPHSNYSINDSGFAYRMFYPSAELLRQVNFDITGKEDLPLFSTPVIERSDLFQQLFCLHTKLVQSDSPLEQESEFIAVMARLITRHASANLASLPSERRYIKIAREYLEAFYMEDLSLRQLATICGVSPFHLLRTFRDEIGLPPFEYQNQLRIAEAKKLLRVGWSIADAAVEIGFVDQSHLTRQFKRIVGVTPGRYSSARNKIQY